MFPSLYKLHRLFRKERFLARAGAENSRRHLFNANVEMPELFYIVQPGGTAHLIGDNQLPGFAE